MNTSRAWRVAAVIICSSTGAAFAVDVYENDFAGWQGAVGQHTTISWDDIDGPWTEGDQHLCEISPDRYVSLPGQPYITSADGTAPPYGVRPSLMGSSGDNFPPVSGLNCISTSTGGTPGYGELTFTFTEPVFAVGAWFLDVEESHPDAGFEIGGTLYHFSQPQGNASQSFLGLILDSPVSSIRLKEGSASYPDAVITDDFSYAIPEPATLSLFALGGLLITRRRW